MLIISIDCLTREHFYPPYRRLTTKERLVRLSNYILKSKKWIHKLQRFMISLHNVPVYGSLSKWAIHHLHSTFLIERDIKRMCVSFSVFSASIASHKKLFAILIKWIYSHYVISSFGSLQLA